MKKQLLILSFIVWSSLGLNAKLKVGQINDYTSIQQKDQIGDNYQEIASDPPKKPISFDVQNEEGAKYFGQKDEGKTSSYQRGSIDKQQEFNMLSANQTQTPNTYNQVIQHTGQKLLTVPIHDAQLNDYDNYIHTKQQSPIYFQQNYNQNQNDQFDIQINSQICQKEALLNYYDKHRLKIKSFFQKAQENKISDSPKFQKILQEMRQYLNSIENRINQLQHGQNNLTNIETIQSFKDIKSVFEVNLEKYTQPVQSVQPFYNFEQKNKVEVRLTKIQKFLDKIQSRQDLEEKQKQVLDEVDDFIQSLKQKDNQYSQVMDYQMKDQVFKLDNQIQKIKQKKQFDYWVDNNFQNVLNDRDTRFKTEKVEIKKIKTQESNQNQLKAQSQSQSHSQSDSQNQLQSKLQNQVQSQSQSQSQMGSKSNSQDQSIIYEAVERTYNNKQQQHNELQKQKQIKLESGNKSELQTRFSKVQVKKKGNFNQKVQSEQDVDSMMQMIDIENDNYIRKDKGIELDQQSEEEKQARQIIKSYINTKKSPEETSIFEKLVKLQPDDKIFSFVAELSKIDIETSRVLEIMREEYKSYQFNRDQSDFNHRIGLSNSYEGKVTDTYIQNHVGIEDMRFQKVKSTVNKSPQNKIINTKNKAKNIETYRFNQKNSINQKMNQKFNQKLKFNQISKQTVKQTIKQPSKQLINQSAKQIVKLKMKRNVQKKSIDDLQHLIDTQIQQIDGKNQN